MAEDPADGGRVARRAGRFADGVWLAAAQDPARVACGGCREGCGRVRGDARVAAGAGGPGRPGVTGGGVAV